MPGSYTCLHTQVLRACKCLLCILIYAMHVEKLAVHQNNLSYGHSHLVVITCSQVVVIEHSDLVAIAYPQLICVRNSSYTHYQTGQISKKKCSCFAMLQFGSANFFFCENMSNSLFSMSNYYVGEQPLFITNCISGGIC